MSRLEKLKQGDPDYEPDMPPAIAEYLLDYLFDVGPNMISGGHPASVTAGELQAWQDLNGLELQPWESRFIRSLSREYVVMLVKAEKIDCREPVAEVGGAGVQGLLVAKNLQRTLEAMAKL